jgi:hypothetical protein
MKSGVWVMIMIVVAALSFLIGYSLAPRYEAPGKVSTSGSAPGGSGGGYGSDQESGGYGSEDSGGYGAEDSGGYGAEDSGGYGVEDSGGYGVEDSGGYGVGGESGGYGQ